MKTYIIPQTDSIYCDKLMNSQEPSIHSGSYGAQGAEQLVPSRKLYI